ncbi:hypothetical protein R1flu_014851 [Riccia fluitans]|uniref:Uncharacterized protein n=1 Tax=Riccia fluitans TaxID=41844 RepID=A0ABD1YHP0_9MARC
MWVPGGRLTEPWVRLDTCHPAAGFTDECPRRGGTVLAIEFPERWRAVQLLPIALGVAYRTGTLDTVTCVHSQRKSVKSLGGNVNTGIRTRLGLG